MIWKVITKDPYLTSDGNHLYGLGFNVDRLLEGLEAGTLNPLSTTT